MALYDRRLEAICASAELGSFTKAASRLHLSVPALVKQVNAFEAENGIDLFVRTRHGCELTAAGESLVEDARSIMRQSGDALRRARLRAGAGGDTVRLGVSLLSPATKTLEAWPRIHELAPHVKLELTPVGDIYDERAGVVRALGDEVDLIQAAWPGERWRGACRELPLGMAPLALDVPRNSPLASRPALGYDDLAHARVHVLRHASAAMDALRDDMAARGIVVIDVEHYDLGLFNECAEDGGVLVTCGAWSGLHPNLVTVPLADPREAECALLYPLEPSPAVDAFVEAYQRVLDDAGHR